MDNDLMSELEKLEANMPVAGLKKTVKKRAHRRKPEPVRTTKVNQQLWAIALEKAGGDPTRLRVTGENSVVVLNNSRKPKSAAPR